MTPTLIGNCESTHGPRRWWVKLDIYNALVELANDLTRRGIPAVIDPRDADAPGALVDLEDIEGGALCGLANARATVYLIVPDNGRALAMQALLDMYEKVEDLTTGAQTVELALPESAPLPALKLNPVDLI